jgi:hypothetical protein
MSLAITRVATSYIALSKGLLTPKEQPLYLSSDGLQMDERLAELLRLSVHNLRAG